MAASTIAFARTSAASLASKTPPSGGGNQDVNLCCKQLLIRAGVAAGKADDLAVGGDVLLEGGDVQPLRVEDRAVGIGDGDDLRPQVVQLPGGEAADVAEALNRDPNPLDRAPPGVLEELLSDDRHAVAGGALSTERAVQFNRLAGDHGRVVAVELAVLVHDPGHHLGVGADVGRGDVLVRADEVVDLLDEPPRDPFDLGSGELVRVDS